MSICLNTAEGAGEFSVAEKARFYRLARRSAAECAAALDVCSALQLGDSRKIAMENEKLKRIVAMLTKLLLRIVPEG